MKTYAMTVGPVVDTLALGRKTSEIWAASYLFSRMMKQTVERLRSEGATFLVPYVDDDALFETADNGVGKFHDRFILQSDTLSIDDVYEAFAAARNDIADDIAEAIQENRQTVRDELQDYIQTALVCFDEPLQNPLLDVTRALDTLELHTPPLPRGDGSLRKFLRRNIVVGSAFAKKSFGKKASFLSIPAIAAQEDDRDIDQAEDFKNAYRYIAVVHADGDNLGATIRDTYGNDPASFSKRLFAVGTAAVNTLETFGAQTIFVGGDDLLFFAPVLHKDGRTVFDLIDALSQDFASALGQDDASLSFGVSVTYYKYPLYEALERSRNALFDKAKRYRGKNAVCVAVQKHSGQSFEFTLGKNETAYAVYRTLVRDVLNDSTELPHSLHHKLDTLHPLIEAKGCDGLKNIFDNFFNEEIHMKTFAKGLSDIQSLIDALGCNAEALRKSFAMLSAIKLLRGDR